MKTEEQQVRLMVHRARQGFVEERTAVINRIRGLLSQFGIVLPLKAAIVRRKAVKHLEELPGYANTVRSKRFSGGWRRTRRCRVGAQPSVVRAAVPPQQCAGDLAAVDGGDRPTSRAAQAARRAVAAGNDGRVSRVGQREHCFVRPVLHGTGTRLNEGLLLRVKDVDFEHPTVIVREGKGGKDRLLMLPQSLVEPLRLQLSDAHRLWDADRVQGKAGVQMPDALDRKRPRAGASWS